MVNRWIFKTVIASVLFFASTLSVVKAQAEPPKEVSTQNSVSPGSNSQIPELIIQEVLTCAAPFFNQVPENFIGMYYSCGCILVEQLDVLLFRVTSGGIGIQVVIDATTVIRVNGQEALNEGGN